MDIFDYLKRYGELTFEDLALTEVDNVILSTLAYLNFDGIVSGGFEYRRLRDAANDYLIKNNRKDVYKLGPAMKNAYRLLEKAIQTERYKNILVHHYKFISNKDTQFGAVTFKLTKKVKFIAFEGTDELLSGWKEDFVLPYQFPVPAHKYAIKYINREISLFDKKVYVGGHSKGGNLALVACMYMRNSLKPKVVKVYSNDGPGLRPEQFHSFAYRTIENKYEHIIPNYSLVGMMLHTDKHDVVESNTASPYCHAVDTWQVEDLKFKRTHLSQTSKEISKSLNRWLTKHTDKELEEICTNCFGAIEDTGLNSLPELHNIKTLINTLKGVKNIDKKYRDEVIEIVKAIAKAYLSGN